MSYACDDYPGKQGLHDYLAEQLNANDFSRDDTTPYSIKNARIVSVRYFIFPCLHFHDIFHEVAMNMAWTNIVSSLTLKC